MAIVGNCCFTLTNGNGKRSAQTTKELRFYNWMQILFLHFLLMGYTNPCLCFTWQKKRFSVVGTRMATKYQWPSQELCAMQGQMFEFLETSLETETKSRDSITVRGSHTLCPCMAHSSCDGHWYFVAILVPTTLNLFLDFDVKKFVKSACYVFCYVK